MNSLVNYASDDDYEDVAQDKKSSESPSSHERTPSHKQTVSDDANYDEVQMDMSEDSNGSTTKNESRSNANSGSSRLSNGDKYSSRDRYKDTSRGGGRRGESPKRRHNHRYDDGRHYGRDNKYRDRYGSGREKRSNREERRRRSRSRSRSPTRKDYRKRSRTPPPPPESKEQKRYDGNFIAKTGTCTFPIGRPVNNVTTATIMPLPIQKPAVEAKLLLESISKQQLLQQQLEMQNAKHQPEIERDRFYMPGITGRFKEQIERRKLLWQKKDNNNTAAVGNRLTHNVPVIALNRTNAVAASGVAGANRSLKVWETTTFAQDQDGRVASKFKRLMGIRESAAVEEAPKKNIVAAVSGSSSGSGAPTDVLKRQEEMFNSMEHQYEVARTATHTMRGVGLGFSSYQR